MSMTKRVAVVFGTYNRFQCLRRAIASTRAAVGEYPYQIIVADGGSTDGTCDYLAACHDVVMLPGDLSGAVKAFNEGFAYAVEHNFDYVMHLNDDAEVVTGADDPDHCPRYPIAAAVGVLEDAPAIGEVAFAFNLRGAWGFEKINGAPYANFGLIRREAGMAVARAQGDASGMRWWNPIYRTYGADCEFGARLWQLGWQVWPDRGLRVHDVNHQDALREANTSNNKHGDADLFWSRWLDVDLVQHVPGHIQQIVSPRVRPTPRGRVRKPNPEYKG